MGTIDDAIPGDLRHELHKIPLETAHNLHVHRHQVYLDDGYVDACLIKGGSGV